MVNGFTSAAYRSHAGVRQGCPLAPVLYLFIAWALNAWLRTCHVVGLAPAGWEGRRLLGDQYADDTHILLRSHSPEDVQSFLRHMAVFARASGQHLNEKKSVLVPVGSARPIDEPVLVQGLKVSGTVTALGGPLWSGGPGGGSRPANEAALLGDPTWGAPLGVLRAALTRASTAAPPTPHKVIIARMIADSQSGAIAEVVATGLCPAVLGGATTLGAAVATRTGVSVQAGLMLMAAIPELCRAGATAGSGDAAADARDATREVVDSLGWRASADGVAAPISLADHPALRVGRVTQQLMAPSRRVRAGRQGEFVDSAFEGDAAGPADAAERAVEVDALRRAMDGLWRVLWVNQSKETYWRLAAHGVRRASGHDVLMGERGRRARRDWLRKGQAEGMCMTEANAVLFNALIFSRMYQKLSTELRRALRLASHGMRAMVDQVAAVSELVVGKERDEEELAAALERRRIEHLQFEFKERPGRVVRLLSTWEAPEPLDLERPYQTRPLTNAS
ncbi:hypothetical protein FOA52_008602 [Chlamydomonas sp. UWO 241]|nr:hypothetical protein FOA52_008602 [Chlamydomonas sp. UWO 241]